MTDGKKGGEGRHEPTGRETADIEPAEIPRTTTGEDRRVVDKKLTEATLGALNETTVRATLENNKRLPEPLRRRLELDLLTNSTADYSRINLTEIFIAFNFDVDQTLTHWRLAKIMDAIVVCHDELRILEENLSPKQIPQKIYDVLAAGKADAKEFTIKLPDMAATDQNGAPPPAAASTIKVSLVDLVYFMDVMKANRELGRFRLPVDELMRNFFSSGTGKKISVNVGEKEIDLLDQNINPEDTYEDINIESYKKAIKNNQSGLQMLGDWRHESGGHRELACQVFIASMDYSSYWIPTSGRLAAIISKEDLQKDAAEGGRKALTGQPQEVGEMEEAATGAIVRFRIADLVQRNVGGDPQRLSGTTRRLAKAEVGLTLNEEVVPEYDDEWETLEDADRKKEKGKKKRRVVHLGGDDRQGKSGDLIRAMHIHYDKAMEKIRGSKLTDDEAYDIAFVDVFAPCLLNNEADWLINLSTVYNVGGKGKAREMLLKPEKFSDFVLRIKCLDLADNKIKWQSFYSFNQLHKYLTARVAAGDIDQMFARTVSARPPAEAKPMYESQEKLSADEGKEYGKLLRELLGDYADSYLEKYAAGETKFPSIRDGQGKRIPYGTTQPVPGRKDLAFEEIIKQELDNLNTENRLAEVLPFINDIFSNAQFEVDDVYDRREEIDEACQAIIDTLGKIPQAGRKKVI